MELILAKHCKSLTGSFGRYYGYAIRRSRKRFFSVRSPKGPRVHDGHLRFIFTCADMARNGFLIADICVPFSEFLDALIEAGAIEEEMVARLREMILPNVLLNAKDVLRVKELINEGVNE